MMRRGVLGDRTRTQNWGGSVLDSVVGAMLTQNVSDHLSSRSFMQLASRFPAKPHGRCLESTGIVEATETPIADPTADIIDWEAVRVVNVEQVRKPSKSQEIFSIIHSDADMRFCGCRSSMLSSVAACIRSWHGGYR